MNAIIADQMQRRREASLRLPPLHTGNRDPLVDPIQRNATRNMTPSTALEIARIGGTLTREQYRAAWQEYPQHRPLLNAVAAAQHEGWGDDQ